MNIKSEISRQSQSLQAELPLLLAVFLKLKFQISTGGIPGNSNAVSELPPHMGMVSNLGILFWCSTAVVCLFTASTDMNKNISVESFLFYSGILTWFGYYASLSYKTMKQKTIPA
jgi:hypothetical protein